MTIVENEVERVLRSTSLPLSSLVGNPDNPREALVGLGDLAASIASIGLLQPLLVVAHDVPDQYMVVDGHRRFAAMMSINYQRAVPVVITEMDRTQRLVAAVAAGAFTRQLKPIERARAFKSMRDEHGLTQTEIARRVGCSQATVNMSLRLLDLDDESLSDLEAGRISTDRNAPPASASTRSCSSRTRTSSHGSHGSAASPSRSVPVAMSAPNASSTP